MQARTLFLSLFAPLALTLSACGDDDTDPIVPEPVPDGTYALVSVNGGSLPYVLSDTGTVKLELTSGQLVLNGDGSCSATATVRTTSSGAETTDSETDSCTWTRNGEVLQFTWADQTLNSANWADDQLTMEDEGWEMVPLDEPASLVFQR